MKKEKLKNSLPGKDTRNITKQIKQPAKTAKENSYTDLVGLAMIILLGIIIYSNSFNCSFHYDDQKSIINNLLIRNLSDVKSLWNANHFRFIPYFTFALNYHFNTLHVWGYHFVNLVIHLINACLVYWLTGLLFDAPILKNNPVTRHKKVISFVTALLFVSHPLATQSVTYIVQRLASMVAMFYLLSVSLYVKARLSEKNKTAKYFLFTGSVIFAVFAMLSKENAFTLPFAIVLFEIFFLQTKKLVLNFKDNRTAFLIVVFLVVIALGLFNFSLSIFKPINPSLANAYTITPLNYFLTQFSVIVKYIQLLILPINQNVDYDFPIAVNFFDAKTFFSFLLLLSLIVLAFFLFKKHRIISFGIFWFFLTLSVESGFVPLSDVIFEHRSYLPSVGFFLILSYCIVVFLWNKNQYTAIALLLVILGSNAFLTFRRNEVWKDDLSLWSDVVSKSPGKARPINNRGLAYKSRNQWNNAIADYTRAIEINPKYSFAYSNRGVAYSNLHEWDKAIADYTRVIEIEPKLAASYNNRGSTYGNLRLWDKAIADFSKAISINPEFANAYFNRGSTYGNIGKWDNAIADFSRAINFDSNYADAYFFRGITYSNLGQWEKAISDYTRAIGIDPKNNAAFSNRDSAIRKLQGAKK